VITTEIVKNYTI
jgi:hypothetical protein